MMIESGFSIELEDCLLCHKHIEDETMYFVPTLGGVACSCCAEGVMHNKIQLPYKMRDFFKQMAVNDFDYKGDYELKATEKVCQVTFETLKSYIEMKSPKKFKSTEVIQQIPV